MIIHCIGDSHTWQFIGKLPENLRVFDNVINYKNVFELLINWQENIH